MSKEKETSLARRGGRRKTWGRGRGARQLLKVAGSVLEGGEVERGASKHVWRGEEVTSGGARVERERESLWARATP